MCLKQGKNGVIRYDISFPKDEGFEMHNDFTVFSRVVPSGKKVVYYYAYDGDGKRRGPWTTGHTSKTAARNYCNKLISKGKLIPGLGYVPVFAEYAKGWWEWETCEYLKDRRKHRNLTMPYAHKAKLSTINHLLPFFGKMKLDAITTEIIMKWSDHMIGKGFKHNTINSGIGYIKVMLKWAARKKLLASNPSFELEALVDDRRPLKIITQDEFKALFLKDWRHAWNGDRLAFLGNKLAALTGMRSGEVLALRGEYVFESHIFVCAQFDRYGYRPTKTKASRSIPLASQMFEELRELMAVNGNGYLFSKDGGATPVYDKLFYSSFMQALGNIGMSKDDIKSRGLCFHSWRHFANTEMQKAGMSVRKVQAVTGHRSDRMTQHYSHFNPLEFTEVPKIQESLLQDGPGNEPEAKQAVLRIIKPEIEQERKMA